MNSRIVVTIMFLIFSFLGIAGCSGGDTAATPPAGGSSATVLSLVIGHDGVDFSAAAGGGKCDGTTTVGSDVQDGYSIFWAPAGGYVAGEDGNSGLIWYNNNVLDTTYYYVEDMGAVSLDSVTTVPGDWPLASDTIPALKAGNTYVVKTLDGYAKFNVSSMDGADSCVPVTVNYVSSATVNFDGTAPIAPTPASPVASTVLMGHFNGVDFSAGEGEEASCNSTTSVAWENQDAYIITWAPTSAGYVTGEADATGAAVAGLVWYNSNEADPAGINYYLQDMGAVSLDSVTSVPGNWPLLSDPVAALKVGSTYVVKTLDGYAKFNVSAIDTTLTCTPVTVSYVASTSTTF